MQTQFSPRRRQRQAYALVISMIFLATVVLIFSGMLSWVSTNTRIIQRNNQYTSSQAAAEAATELALATMQRDFLAQSLTSAVYYASIQVNQSNWPVKYVFSDVAGVTNRISVFEGQTLSVLQPVGSQYPNLRGYPCFWTNVATATPVGQPYCVPATVSMIINFSTVPVFQYAIFYNLNLEIDPGATMVVKGPVWSNAGLWAGTANLTFNDTVSAVNTADTSTIDPFCGNKTDSSAPPHFDLTGQPTSNNTRLTMPIGGTNSNPTNVEAMLNIPPSTYAMGTSDAYSTNGLIFLANGADIIISNCVSGTNSGVSPAYSFGRTNISIWFQDRTTPANYLTPLKPNFYIITNVAGRYTYPPTNYIAPNVLGLGTNIFYAGWTFVTNEDFYDYRESDTVQAVQINVGLFNAWLADTSPNGGSNYNFTCRQHMGHTIDGIWVFNSVPRTLSTLPAVRVVNGIQLNNSYGLTVATPMPIYVLGHYNKQQSPTLVSSGGNTANTYPAALMGDSITILSSSWRDTYDSSMSLGSRAAPVPTTVNAACLEGIVQSTGNYYSGGVENFIRYLEDWSGVTNTYNGSIVVMFPSIYATNRWGSTGTYYQPPKREWGFDFNFTDPNKLPPLTPMLKKLTRMNWSSKY